MWFRNKKKRARRGPPWRPPQRTEEQILAWADAWFERTGRWPHVASGRIPGALGVTWSNVESNLRRGHRGLPYRTTLAQLLAERRGVRNHMRLPRLTEGRIVAWADVHHRVTGAWPTADCGPVTAAPEETWMAADAALRDGNLGLPGGSSLALLLARNRGVRNPQALPRLTQRQVLAWADAHRGRTGQWPTRKSGAVWDAAGETWSGVDTALRDGLRGLPGGTSLARLLARHRGVSNLKALPRRTIQEVLAWADAHHRRTGQWPTRMSGAIHGIRGESWKAIDSALRQGVRGFPGGLSLARLFGPTPRRPQFAWPATADKAKDPRLGRRISPAHREVAGQTRRTGGGKPPNDVAGGGHGLAQRGPQSDRRYDTPAPPRSAPPRGDTGHGRERLTPRQCIPDGERLASHTGRARRLASLSQTLAIGNRNSAEAVAFRPKAH